MPNSFNNHQEPIGFESFICPWHRHFPEANQVFVKSEATFGVIGGQGWGWEMNRELRSGPQGPVVSLVAFVVRNQRILEMNVS